MMEVREQHVLFVRALQAVVRIRKSLNRRLLERRENDGLRQQLPHRDAKQGEENAALRQLFAR